MGLGEAALDDGAVGAESVKQVVGAAVLPVEPDRGTSPGRVDRAQRLLPVADFDLGEPDAQDGRHARCRSGDVDDPGRQRREVLTLDDQVGADGPVEGVEERALEPVDEDRDEDDEADTDHEGGGGTRRAGGIAHRVLASQAGAGTEQALQRPADGACDRADEHPHRHAHADQDQQGSDADQRQRLTAVRAAEAGDDGEHAEKPEQHADVWGEPGETRLREHRPLAEHRDRGDARRADRRNDRGDESDADADDERHDHGPGLKRDAGRREAEADGVEDPVEQHREQHADRDADDRRDQADDGGFDQDASHDLAAARADRPQHRHLPHALGDGDREHVEDDERADEHGDPREHEQEAA